jgi:RNA polymerase subunit RPABC4/transcription elongation factor Spt4
MDALLEQAGGIIGGIFDTPVVRLLTFGFVAYVAMLWLASAYWVLGDMRRRHSDASLAYVAAGGVIIASPVLFPLALVVYRILRPSETLAEARERELTERLEELDEDMALACPGCTRAVEEDWLVCPACRTRLAHKCVSCGRTMGLDWSLCGWCGTEFGRPVLPDRLPRAIGAGPVPARERDGVRAAGGRRDRQEPATLGPRRAYEPGA